MNARATSPSVDARKHLRARLWHALAKAVLEVESLGGHLPPDVVDAVTQEFARDVQRTVRGGR